MKQAFKNHRINKRVSRKGIDVLLKKLKKRTSSISLVVCTTMTSQNEIIQQLWELYKRQNNKCSFINISSGLSGFRTEILNLLSVHPYMTVMLVCDMGQKLEGEPIQEIWGFKIYNNGKKTKTIDISCNELYNSCTTNVQTGKSIPPEKNSIYCGPDGKICGFDMV